MDYGDQGIIVFSSIIKDFFWSGLPAIKNELIVPDR